ncbi:MAG: hypothetical protein QM690_11610 [Sphingobium sp.]
MKKTEPILLAEMSNADNGDFIAFASNDNIDTLPKSGTVAQQIGLHFLLIGSLFSLLVYMILIAFSG